MNVPDVKQTMNWCRARPRAAQITIVVPVFNQESIIQRNLKALEKSLSVEAVLIVIDDASQDNSFREILEFLDSLDCSESTLQAVTAISLFESVFETRCDNLAFASADTPYLLEVQADMELTEHGFDAKLLRAMTAHKDLFMVSGRGVEPILPVARQYRASCGTDRSAASSLPLHVARRALAQVRARRGHARSTANVAKTSDKPLLEGRLTDPDDLSQVFPDQEHFSQTCAAGRLGPAMDTLLTDAELSRGSMWVGQSVMRGPLLIEREKYLEVGGLDVDRFFQGYDDHDLCVRAYEAAGYRCAFVPVGFRSPLEEGTSRRPRSLKSEWRIMTFMLKIRRSWKTSALYRVVLKPERLMPRCEIRSF